MRTRLSSKIFAVFSVITAFTLVMGLVSLAAVKGIQKTNSQLLLIKEFEIQTSRVEALKHEAVSHGTPQEEKAFKLNLAKINEIAKRMKVLRKNLGGELSSRLDSLPSLITNYERAFEDFIEGYRKDRAYLRNSSAAFAALELRAETLRGQSWKNTETIIHLCRNLALSAYFERDPEAIAGLRGLFADKNAEIPDSSIQERLNTLILDTEANYINHLYLVDREAFLNETSMVFARVTGDIASAISESLDAQQKRINFIITAIVVLSLLVTATFWVLVSRYTRRFLQNLTSAIESIESENYDYEVRFSSNDEFGSLTLFVKRMAMALKENMQKVRKGRAFLQKIIDGIAEPVMYVSTDYRIKLLNRKAAEEAGESINGSEELLCHELSHRSPKPCSSTEHPCPIRLVQDSGQKASVEHIHYDRQGSRRIIEILASPMFDDEGRFEGIIEASRDITDRRKLEEQLLHSEKMNALGSLTGGIAHDFNNFLTSIIGYAEMIEQASGDEEIKKYSSIVLASAERATELTRSLLAFGRKQMTRKKAMDLNTAAYNIEKMLLRLLGADISIDLKLHAKPLVINADQGQIEQIVMNLATNARDAMPDGGTLIISSEQVNIDRQFVDTHAILSPGAHALLIVSDTGVGMDENTRDRAFEPYFTTKSVGRGTGLGLSVVYGLVKQNGGEIVLYSEPGKGSTFRIYIPLTEATIDTASQKEPPAPRGGTETILIAEDDETVRGLLSATLEKYGYRVIETADGQKCVEAFKSNSGSIALLVLDVIMPGLNGAEAFRQIRNIDKNVPVLFISGYATGVLDAQGISEMDFHYVTKPVSPSDLLRKIRSILDSA